MPAQLIRAGGARAFGPCSQALAGFISTERALWSRPSEVARGSGGISGTTSRTSARFQDPATADLLYSATVELAQKSKSAAQYADSLRYLEEWSSLRPNDPEPHRRMAEIYILTSRPAQAAAEQRKADRLSRNPAEWKRPDSCSCPHCERFQNRSQHSRSSSKPASPSAFLSRARSSKYLAVSKTKTRVSYSYSEN